MLKNNLILALILAFFFTGCSIHQVAKTHPRPLFVFMKSEFLKANNQAFLYHDNEGLQAEFYELGRPFMKLSISTHICINKSCYSKTAFNKHFFKQKYYPSLLEEIILFKPIFKGKNIIKTQCGFSQKIGKIFYSICQKELVFEDKSSGLKIILNED